MDIGGSHFVPPLPLIKNRVNMQYAICFIFLLVCLEKLGLTVKCVLLGLTLGATLSTSIRQDSLFILYILYEGRSTSDSFELYFIIFCIYLLSSLLTLFHHDPTKILIPYKYWLDTAIVNKMNLLRLSISQVIFDKEPSPAENDSVFHFWIPTHFVDRWHRLWKMYNIF